MKILRIFEYELGLISNELPMTISRPECLSDCTITTTCYQNLTAFLPETFFGQSLASEPFNPAYYGAECAALLTEKRAELLSSGVVDKISREFAFQRCLYEEREYRTQDGRDYLVEYLCAAGVLSPENSGATCLESQAAGMRSKQKRTTDRNRRERQRIFNVQKEASKSAKFHLKYKNNTRLAGLNAGLALLAKESDVLDRRNNTLDQYGWQCRLKTR